MSDIYTFIPKFTEMDYREEQVRNLKSLKPSTTIEDIRTDTKSYLYPLLVYTFMFLIIFFCVKEEARLPFLVFMLFITVVLLILWLLFGNFSYLVSKTIAEHRKIDVDKLNSAKLVIDVNRQHFTYQDNYNDISISFTSSDIMSWGIDVQKQRVAGIRLSKSLHTYSEKPLKWYQKSLRFIKFIVFGKELCDFMQLKSVNLTLPHPVLLNDDRSYTDFIQRGNRLTI